MPVNTELVARLLQPIAGDNPAGADLRYDPRLDALKEARREELDLPGVTNRKVADWPTVISTISTLLSEHTKDLQLSIWLTEALLQKQGFAGFATGLEVTKGLVAQYWETLYPLPEDGELELRIGPVEWLGAKLGIPTRSINWTGIGLSYEGYLASRRIPTESEADSDKEQRALRAEKLEQGQLPPEKVDVMLEELNKTQVRAALADIDLALTSLAALEKVTDEKFGRDAPAYTDLRNALDENRRFLAGQLARKLETDPDPEVPDAVSDDAAVDAAEDGTLSVEPKNRADASTRIGVVARWLRAQDATNPAPYLMVRGFRWGELRAQAPEVDPKLLEAPATAIRARIKTLLIDGKWSDLLEQSEVLMASASGRGWLDLQRYVLTACLQLGGSYDAVGAAIRSELRALLSALPQLPRMTLMDDTPAANDETREWLEGEGLMPDPAAATAEDAPAEGEDSAPSDGAELMSDALVDDASAAQQGGFSRSRAARRSTSRGPDAFDVARAELAQGRPNRAIELLMAELSRDQSPRGRFVRQTQIAYVMVEAGLDAVARPILQSLIATIDEKGLEQWESGPLVAQPMALMCRVIDRMGDDDGSRTDLYLRVCRLDPLQALALQGR